MHFRGPHAKAWAEACQPGDEIFYEREPENQYDPSAIKILYNFQHMGYVERGQAAFIAPHIDDGVEFSCIVSGTQQEKLNIVPLVTFRPVEKTEELVEVHVEA